MNKEIISLSTKIKHTSDKLLPTKENGITDILCRELEKLGFIEIGGGLSRRVFLSPDKKYVIKIETDHSLTCYCQNQNEIDRYSKLPKKARKYYIKPLAYDKQKYRWVIYKTVETCFSDNFSFEEAEKIKKRLNIILKRMEVHIGLDDLGVANIGRVNGKPIMVDYGW